MQKISPVKGEKIWIAFWGPTALELELTAKGRERYEKLFYEYSRKSELALLWYIVGDEKLAALLKREWRRVNIEGGNPRLAITSPDELLSNPRIAMMEFCTGKKRRILEVFDLPKEIKTSGTHAALGVSNLGKEKIENLYEAKAAQLEEKSSAPDFRVSRPFTADHSPSTSDGEWSALTGKELVSGADKTKNCA